MKLPAPDFEKITWRVLNTHPRTEEMKGLALRLTFMLTILSQFHLYPYWGGLYFALGLWVQLALTFNLMYYGLSWIFCSLWRRNHEKEVSKYR